jgi:hypothetical protein
LRLIIAFIIGFLLASTFSYGYRSSKPQRITDFDQKGLVVINENFERLFDITNGRYSPNSGSAASTGTGTVKMGSAGNSNNAGWFKFEKSDGTTVYVPYWTTDKP